MVERDNLLVISLLERKVCVGFVPVPVVPVFFEGMQNSITPIYTI